MAVAQADGRATSGVLRSGLVRPQALGGVRLNQSARPRPWAKAGAGRVPLLALASTRVAARGAVVRVLAQAGLHDEVAVPEAVLTDEACGESKTV